MNIYFFLFLQFLLLVLRAIIAIPLIVLKNFVRPLSKRIDFERGNLFNQASESFKELNLKADYFFHVSSEGELEQVRSIIDYFLESNKRIEICYTSPSVEKKCIQYYEKNPSRVRIYRLPIASFFPINFLYFQSIFQFISADKVIMCRYDFFPELLLLKWFNKKLILVSAATKKMNWYKESALNCFDDLIAANEKEGDKLSLLLHKKINSFDFRLLSIWSRKVNFETKTKNDSRIFDLVNYIKNFDGKKIIIGSAWEEDLKIITPKLIQEDFLILIAPHKLNNESINQIREILNDHNPFIYNGDQSPTNQKLIISTIPGILCELYQYFDVAYVGGGFGKSIHSVLEPFLMGAKIITGPNVNRSTEFDFCVENSANEIVKIESPELFENALQELILVKDSINRDKLIDTYQNKLNAIIKVLN